MFPLVLKMAQIITRQAIQPLETNFCQSTSTSTELTQSQT